MCVDVIYRTRDFLDEGTRRSIKLHRQDKEIPKVPSAIFREKEVARDKRR